MSQFIEMFNGEFPKERWEECLTITNGKKYDGEYQETGTYPICGSGGIMGYGEQKLCPKDTVILGRKGNINSPIYMESDYWIVDTAFCLDVDKQKLQPKFFFYWCILFDFTRYNKQGVLPSLTKNDLLKIDIPIPPMDLQTKFVNIQEQADKSEFDCLKSQFIEMFGDPMTNDKQWPEYRNIKEVAQVVLGTTPNSKEPTYWDGDIRWITPAEMTDKSYIIYDTERHITEAGRRAANLTMLPEGTVLFSTRAPIGKVGIVGKEMCCNQGFKNFICSESLNNVFLYYTLKFKKEYLCSLGTGTTFKELSKRTVESLKIAVPPIALQMQFESIYNQADKSEYLNNYRRAS